MGTFAINDFYGDDNYLYFAKPFPRFSAFHAFIEFVINDALGEEDIALDIRQDNVSRFGTEPSFLQPDWRRLPIEFALTYYGFNHTSFTEWLKQSNTDFLEARDDHVDEYYSYLREDGAYDALLERAVEEVFFVLFQNRRVLLLFNDMMARQMEDAKHTDIPDELRLYFSAKSVLARVGTPIWVQRAVFYVTAGFVSSATVICRDCCLLGTLKTSTTLFLSPRADLMTLRTFSCCAGSAIQRSVIVQAKPRTYTRLGTR